MVNPADGATPPSFLRTPARSVKPRSSGITHVLDKGCSVETVCGLLNTAGAFFDVWKFGWGTAYLDPHVRTKVALLSQHGVKACTGGTLLEIAWSQQRTGEFLEFAGQLGFPCVEVSNGATPMPAAAKRALIVRARELGFEVISEIGSKDPGQPVSAERWLEGIADDVDAGASWVVAEGRESGTVGLYDTDGGVRGELVEALESSPAAARLIYEAPQRSQQAWLLRRIGPAVNLGNIALDEIMSVESLRMGLRTDTIGIDGWPHFGGRS
jgi:phosphosulfolactate synthase